MKQSRSLYNKSRSGGRLFVGAVAKLGVLGYTAGYTNFEGRLTQLAVGADLRSDDEGLKHESAVMCDALLCIPKSLLANYMGRLSSHIIRALNRCLIATLKLEEII